MSLSNLSQVLLRNEDLLLSNAPLLINMPADELSSQLYQKNSASQITHFTSNFELHLDHKKLTTPSINTIFAASYQKSVLHDLIIIHFPKSKNELKFILAMLPICTNNESVILIVGENKSGIKSIDKLTKDTFNYCDKVDSARHCLLFQAQLSENHTPFNIDDWFHYYQVSIENIELNVAALPGVFSQAKLDIGTAVLLENLSNKGSLPKPKQISGKLLDFGCGAGVIACFLGLKHKEIELTLADVSALAIESAIKTLAINGLSGNVIATNSLSNISGKYQYVFSNPPFHQGIKTHYAATENFLTGIKAHINKGGSLTIVANSFLKYQDIMEKSIGKTQRLCNKQGFSIYQSRN